MSPSRIDLHTHSAASDGTDTPAGVVAAAAAAGLDCVALTDHDGTAGWDEAAAEAQRRGIALVRGAELSTRHAGMSVHLLAYLFDPQEPALLAEMERTRTDREPRLRRIVANLAADGYDLTWEDVEAAMSGSRSPGRPHVADALVAKGHASDRSEVFARLLHSRSRYYEPQHASTTADAIALVRAAGGVPVLAHPFAEARGRVLSGDHVRALAEAGLAGIEVDHRDHDDAQRALAASLAAELDLVPTGSSDYHGTGKPNLIGEHLTAPESLARIEALARGAAVLR